ncbi:MAG: multicopper oxidase domain-containing protein, partial [Acidobacteriota bacterium]|nr:multicopper oxidase domain-containing protein [Acidobacteriota bacterium]
MESKHAHACHTAPLNTTPGSSFHDPAAIRVVLEARATNWEAAPGVTIAGYGYNGQVPGPVIEAKQGVPLEIEFTNRLSEPTIIHWHGLR